MCFFDLDLKLRESEWSERRWVTDFLTAVTYYCRERLTTTTIKSPKCLLHSNFETSVFQRGPLFWKYGVNVALGLGVADDCCRLGKVPFAFVPSTAIRSPKHCIYPLQDGRNKKACLYLVSPREVLVTLGSPWNPPEPHQA